MRRLHGFATLILLFITLHSTASYTDEYIQGYKDIAQREMQRSGIPASVILAQGIFESAWGRGKLALNSNNHFGIKCKDYWEGPTYYHKDDDYINGKLIKSCFRAYNSVEDSYIDHTDFLLETKHYQDLFDYDETDYRNWAYGLKRCGYATDPSYAEKLISLIERYQLHEFDQLLFFATDTNFTPTTTNANINDLMINTTNTVETEVMDAPAYYVPETFLQDQPSVVLASNFTPVNQLINNNNYSNNVWSGSTQEVAPNTRFSYEVTPPAVEETSVEVPVQQSSAFMEPQLADLGSVQTPATSVMPNRTTNDRRLKNLSRRPRMSGGTGPR